MQPDWLQNCQQRLLYKLILGLINGLINGLTRGLIDGLFLGLILGLIYDNSFIEPVEVIQFSVTQIRINTFLKNFILWLIYGLIYGLILGLIIGLILGLIYGLVDGLKSDLKTKFIPSQGIWASFKNTLFITVIFNILFFSSQIWLKPFLINFLKLDDVTSILSASQALTFFFALVFSGGLACIQHVSLRLVLWRSGYIPCNYAQFLNRAAQRRLIQQVGGRYRFIHRLLLDHFANMHLS